jgi:alkanesulfonate monooxygenase SsuD/methylene tetrahydromethanopterin reductase-like flavin-dependent oxidoreductase (luciferase family)
VTALSGTTGTELQASNQNPFRLGFFTHVHGHDATQLYRSVVELFVAAEELGYDSGWVAQHHFHPEHGRLSSPLVLLAGAAARTSRIQLGTAIVALPFEDPLRLAEDAAVLDALSGGRLQLGLGSGVPAGPEFAAFGQDPAVRHETYDAKLGVLRDALAGKPLADSASGAGAGLQPAAPGLDGRIWSSATRPETVRAAAAAGHGLLLGVGPHNVVQDKLAELFRATWAEHWPDRQAPVAAVRGIFPGASRKSVASVLGPDVSRYLPHHVAAGWARDASISTDELLGLMNVQYGTPQDIVTSLSRDAVFGARATHLVAAIQAESTSLKEVRRNLEVLATEIAPALGWRPSTDQARAEAPHGGA